MSQARLRNTPEDYKELGLKKGEVEVWEDGFRSGFAPGSFEWWYFDAVMDDGSSVSLNLSTKMVGESNVPAVTINATSSDGEKYKDVINYTSEDGCFSKEQCDVKIGPHYFKGNLKEYEIKVDPVNGIGCDLKLKSRCRSWRPETGHVVFDDAGKYFTWLFVVPQGDVSGTLTIEGETYEVKGEGYHDHQWGTINLLADMNSWIWGRQIFDDYTVLMFDFITNQATGYQRFPLFCVEDKNGNVVFDNTVCDDGFKCEVAEEYDEKDIGKMCPKRLNYTYEHGGKKIKHTLIADKNIYVNDMYRMSPEALRAQFDQMGLAPAYVRYHAGGEFEMTTGSDTIKRSGNLIYEFAYFSTHYADVMDHR